MGPRHSVWSVSHVTWPFKRHVTPLQMWLSCATCDVTRSHVTWRIRAFICDMTHSYATWRIHMWYVTWRIRTQHDSFTCVVGRVTSDVITHTSRDSITDMSAYSFTWHKSRKPLSWVEFARSECVVLYVIWCDHVWHDPFVCGTTHLRVVCGVSQVPWAFACNVPTHVALASRID